jgi:hypothetical protein
LARTIVVAAVLGIGGSGPALADPSGNGARSETPGAKIDETLARLLGLIQTFLESVPTFEPPEILDNGDILIRRKRSPEREAPKPPEPDPEKSAPPPDTSRT